MIGLAFATATNAQNMGYIIPNEEIEMFLRDVADGRYDGKPAMLDYIQTLENPVLRQFLKVDKSVEGAVVQRPHQKDGPLKEWDIITHIGDSPIDNQGMVKLGPNLRVRFQYRVQQLAKDGKVPLTIVRAGKPMQVQLPVGGERKMLIPDLDGGYPSYFIYGPMVFSRATAEFVGVLGRQRGRHQRAQLHRQPADHAPRRRARRAARRAGGGQLAVLPAQARHRLQQPLRVGDLFDQQGAGAQPGAPGDAVARPQGRAGRDPLRPARRRERSCSRARKCWKRPKPCCPTTASACRAART